MHTHSSLSGMGLYTHVCVEIRRAHCFHWYLIPVYLDEQPPVNASFDAQSTILLKVVCQCLNTMKGHITLVPLNCTRS